MSHIEHGGLVECDPCCLNTAMQNNIRSWMTALASILAVTGQASEDIKGFAPVSVSSANYRTTERAELVRKVSEKNQVNPVLAKSVPRSTPAHYIFMPGEIYESDLTYEQLCKLLTPALASKGFINGSDDQGIIREPDRVELILKKLSHLLRPPKFILFLGSIRVSRDEQKKETASHGDQPTHEKDALPASRQAGREARRTRRTPEETTGEVMRLVSCARIRPGRGPERTIRCPG